MTHEKDDGRIRFLREIEEAIEKGSHEGSAPAKLSELYDRLYEDMKERQLLEDPLFESALDSFIALLFARVPSTRSRRNPSTRTDRWPIRGSTRSFSSLPRFSIVPGPLIEMADSSRRLEDANAGVARIGILVTSPPRSAVGSNNEK